MKRSRLSKKVLAKRLKMRAYNFLKSYRYQVTAALLAVLFVVSALYLINTNKKYVRQMKDYEILLSYNPLEGLELEGGSAYIYNPQEEVALYSKNSDTKVPIASITKVMTIVVALENLPTTSTVTISPPSLWVEGESGFYPFEVWGLRDLADFTLIESSNDGADALARATEAYYAEEGRRVSFTDLMNQKAREIGLKDTEFYNPTGLDLSLSRAGAYSSAEDVVRLFEYTLENHPSFLASTALPEKSFVSYSGFSHKASNTNILADDLPNLYASKTGFTDLAGGNLAVVIEVEGERYIMSVLGSSIAGRFSDIVSLHDAIRRLEKYEKARSVLEHEIKEIIEQV